MILKYKGEEIEYTIEELLKLEDDGTIGIDFNGAYMVEFKKDTKSGLPVPTGRCMDGHGNPINVAMFEVVIEDD